MSLHVKNSGEWKQVSAAYVKDSGTWKSCLDVHINDSGTWKSALYEAGSQNFTTSGSFTFTVPAGVSSLTATTVGGGGGGGGAYSSGDWWTGAAGGSGGYINSTSYSVTAGEDLSITVGAGGLRASQYFNSWYQTEASPMSEVAIGQSGEDSAVRRVSTDIARATGGGGGGAGTGACGGGGSGGTPSGVDGDERGGVSCGGYGFSGTRSGGSNGSGYGDGGDSNRAEDANEDGGDGAVLLSW